MAAIVFVCTAVIFVSGGDDYRPDKNSPLKKFLYNKNTTYKQYKGLPIISFCQLGYKICRKNNI